MSRASVIPHLAFNISTRRFGQSTGSALHPTLFTPRSHRTASSYTTPKPSSPHTSPRLPNPPPKSVASPARDASEAVTFPSRRSGQGYLWFVSIFGVVSGIYAVTLGIAEYRASKKNAELDLEQNADVSHRWKDSTRNFDQEVDNEESVMLMRAKRSRLIKEAYGKVLEVSVGTGRNMDLYDLRPYDPKEEKSSGRSRERIISSLTFNDQSEVMVQQAANKFLATELKKNEDERFTGDVTFVIGDAGNKGVIERPPGGFDTIVQTFGICSMARPAEFLQTLGKLCRQPGEGGVGHTDGDRGPDEGGKILLLEHGHGKFDWLNRYLDSKAKLHALHYGCWFNKDIDEVIQTSGLKVERVRQYHLGTTWEIVLRPTDASTKRI